MKKLNLNKLRRKREPRDIIPNANLWTTITTVVLFLCAYWLLQGTLGWINGDTMVKWYGMDPVLADTIMACPDILFFATYYTLGVSAILFGVVFWVLFRYMTDEMGGYEAVIVVMICTLVAIWSFPIVHVITDMTATGAQLEDGLGVMRDTRSFDVFQLGIKALPLLGKSAVCCVILWVNRKVQILT